MSDIAVRFTAIGAVLPVIANGRSSLLPASSLQEAGMRRALSHPFSYPYTPPGKQFVNLRRGHPQSCL